MLNPSATINYTPIEFSSEQYQQGHKLFTANSDFVTSVTKAQDLPSEDIPEIAFAGRSNSGKSSLLNALLNRKSLVRVSKQPGQTQSLNFFSLAQRLHLVDMPGYGYAKVSKSIASEWNQLIRDYVKARRNLRLLCLLIDARRSLMATDKDLMSELDNAGVVYLIVLTKCDKLHGSRLNNLCSELEGDLKQFSAAYPKIFATSAHKGLGVSDLRAFLADNIYVSEGL